ATASRASCSTSRAARRSRPGSASRSSWTGCSRSPTRSGRRRSSPSRPRTPPSSSSRASPTAPRCGRSTRSRYGSGSGSVAEPENPEPDLDAQALFEQIREFDVQQFLVASISTLASLAFAKLDSGDLGQARTAIDAVAALLPLVEGEPARDLQGALTNLQVAYAGRSV